MIKREEQGAAALKRAEAVAREYDLSIQLKLVRARVMEEAIMDLTSHGEYDMVVVSTRKEELHRRNGFLSEMEKLLKDVPPRSFL